jgi:hypothetical protein
MRNRLSSSSPNALIVQTNARLRQQLADQQDSRASGPPSLEPFVVDIVGPSGAGKSSLADALQHSKRVVGLAKPPKPVLYYHLLKTIVPLSSSALCGCRSGRWFTRSEMAVMASVSATHSILLKHYRDDVVVAIKKGPLYQLAFLQMFGPPRRQTEIFHRWHNEWFDLWSRTIGLMVWLDAPDPVLFRRINSRNQHHPLKGKQIEHARPHFARQRQVINTITSSGRFLLLRIDTSRKVIPECVSHIVEVLEDAGGRHPQ